MNLTSTTHSLELVTGSAQSLDYSLSWTDIDKSGASTVTTPGSNSGNVSAATTTTVVLAPAANVHRVITTASFANAGAASNAITVQRDVGGNNRKVVGATLAAGESLHFEDGRGWYVLTAAGELKGLGQTGAAGSNGLNGAVAIAEAIVNFGATTTDFASVVVTDAGISTSSKFLCQFSGGSTADNDADAHALMQRLAEVTPVPAAGSVTFNVRMYDGTATGQFKLRYTYS